MLRCLAISTGGIRSTANATSPAAGIHAGGAFRSTSQTSSTDAGEVGASSSCAPSRSNFGSFASIPMRNRSSVDRRNRESRNRGLLHFGSPLSSSIPKKEPNAANRIVSSKLTGMFAGMLQSGLPEMR